MHSLLARQLKKCFGQPSVPAEWGSFLQMIDMAYRQFDDDRAMLERSLELSSHELLQANAELQATLESTRRLQAQVVRAEKMSAVGQLAAGVAHEINNPLSVILGFAQAMVRRSTPGDRDSGPMRHIEREAIRCKNLVQDLLTFSRVAKPELVPMCLNEAVRGSLSLVHAQARTRQVEVKVVLSDDLPPMLGQANQVQQVVINLATNALDAMSKGGILTVTTEVDEGWIRLRVLDTGVGIPADVIPRIFEPFFTTKPVGQGTGLGLSLAYEITIRHAGMIDVRSRPGDTEFNVRFPIGPSETTSSVD
jgi:two-component system, NtrC family, sensor kinase